MTEDLTVTGRQIRLEPLPPGLWMIILGGGLGVLAPLFGFLIGSVLGPGDASSTFGPMMVALFTGIVIGGVGVLAAIFGGLKLFRHFNARSGEDEG